MPLEIALRKRLRARAHTLKPVIQVGDAGLSEALLAEARRAIDHHELIKVKLPALERGARDDMARVLCEALDAEQVQAIGRVRVLYRAREEEPGRTRGQR